MSDRFVHLEPLAHFLLRPQIHVGSVQATADGFCEAAKKMFDEVLQNACDNTTTTRPGKPTTHIDVTISTETICIVNDGRTIPIEQKADWNNQWIIEGLITRWGSSENFNDDIQRQTAGLNGIGLKAVAALSKEFIIICKNGKLKYSQTFKNNLASIDPPVISACKEKEGTMVQFSPDFNKVFRDVPSYKEMVPLLERTVHRTAAFFPKTKFTLNGAKLDYATLDKYHPAMTRKAEAGQELLRFAWYLSPDGFQYEAMCNGVDNPHGGTHVKAVADALVDAYAKRAKVPPNVVKPCLGLIVFYTAVNPSFNAQIKTEVTSKLPKALVEAIKIGTLQNDPSGIIDHVVAKHKALAGLKINRELGGVTKKATVSVPDLIDAPVAGRKGCERASLFITEGASAQTMAVEGFAVVGNELYGSLPIRGKITNVEGMGFGAVLEKIPAVSSIARALGLRQGTKPGDHTLRYGKVILMTDQDSHGAHITGLLLAMFAEFWPELLRGGFVWKFITPVVKAFRQGETTRCFFDEDSFAAFDASGWSVRFYKGLGSSDPEEVRSYFANLPLHLKRMTFHDAEDAAKLAMFYDKKRADDRKRWMALPRGPLDYTLPEITVRGFVDNELHAYANSQARDVLPGFTDGLKVVQRKILHIARRAPRHEWKVPSLGGLLVSDCAYHHGDTSAHDAIIKMAASYPTSNNLPLLIGHGATGSRLGAGKTPENQKTPKDGFSVGGDAASARYVSVSMAPITNHLFLKEDDPVLSPSIIDGLAAEPEWFFPVLPLLLINGTEGIASGHMSSVPAHKPLDVLHAVRCCLRGEAFDLVPGHLGFKGTYTRDRKGWLCRGIYPNGAVTELPATYSILGYRSFLEKLVAANKIKSFSNKSHSNAVLFEIEWNGGEEDAAILALSDFIKAHYCVLDMDGSVRYFETVHHYLEAWVKARLGFIETRRQATLLTLQRGIDRAMEKKRKIQQAMALPSGIGRQEMSAALGKEFASALLIWSISPEGLAEADAEIAKAQAHLAAYEAWTALTLYEKELADLEPHIQQAENEVAKRNFIIKRRK